jgi:hypothetical protein
VHSLVYKPFTREGQYALRACAYSFGCAKAPGSTKRSTPNFPADGYGNGNSSGRAASRDPVGAGGDREYSAALGVFRWAAAGIPVAIVGRTTATASASRAGLTKRPPGSVANPRCRD